MMDITPEQARTLAAVVDAGTFEAAAVRLTVTPSAISQRMRALEIAVGRPVLRRVRPVELTASGEAVLRFARQLELISAELDHELQPADRLPRVTIVVNADSLHVWVLPALIEVGASVQLEIIREDQDHSLNLLRQGAAAAAITAVAAPAPGCSARRLGVMRYRAACAPQFLTRWSKGRTIDFANAPMIVFDRKDTLQDQFLNAIHPAESPQLDPPRHFLPATEEFDRAIRGGLGWGMVSELTLEDGSALLTLPGRPVDVPLHWQQWRLRSAALDRVAVAVATAAGVLRR